MKLSELIKDLHCRKIHFNDLEINGLSYDSRKVSTGDLFFCINGFKSDGHDFAFKAVESGAKALVVTKELPIEIPQILVDNDRTAMAEISAMFYDYPSKKLKMIGITGTNGKTTITYMLKAIGEAAGKKVGLIGTIANMIGDKTIQTERTTPESLDLQKLLNEMVNENCEWAVMEVSSHSLSLFRVYGIKFNVAVFTNLTQEHMDYHKTMQAYALAKKELFKNTQAAVLNADDEYCGFMADGLKCKIQTYAIDTDADFTAKEIVSSPNGVEYKLDGQKISVPIPGKFSAYNSLSAIAAAKELDIKTETVIEALSSMQTVPGRFELLTRDKPYSVILDYAHTPDSLENALITARGITSGRLICVFGCGGNRDKIKRRLMGETAAKYADFSIITSDNPRNEDPKEIILDIQEGISEASGEYIVIENRYNAIEYAIDNAHNNDTILLAGKGHETYQEIGGIKYDFDEKKITREIISRKESSND